MKKFFNKLIITPFLIVFGMVEIVLFYYFINYTFINNQGGMALGGTIAFIALLLFFVILFLEQSLLKNINYKNKKIWVIEILILIVLIIYISINGISIG